MEGYKEDNPEDYTKEIILRSNKFIGRIGSLVYMKEEDLLIASNIFMSNSYSHWSICRDLQNRIFTKPYNFIYTFSIEIK